MPPKLELVLLEPVLSVCRLAPGAALPSWAANSAFLSITRTDDELSIVCCDWAVPDGVKHESGWRCLRVTGQLAFTSVGVLACLASPLAEAGISIFVLSTFDTDYLLVKEHDLGRASAALTQAGHVLRHATCTFSD
jgi:hypothetical protein